MLFAVIGANEYGVFCNFLAPRERKISLLTSFKFKRHNQLESESVTQVMVGLKQLGMNSEFFLKKCYGTDLFVDSKTYKSRRCCWQRGN